MNMIKNIIFLCCCIMPIHSLAMIGRTPKKQTRKIAPVATYAQLINTLPKRTVSITELLRCLEDAKEHKKIIYLISRDLIENSDLKDKILSLFASSPDIFKDEADIIFFQVSAIDNGFICAINNSLFTTPKKSTLIVLAATKDLPIKTEEKKLTILNTFNIKQTTPDEPTPQQINDTSIITFPLGVNTELEDLYNTIVTKKERSQKLIQEKETATPEIPSQPEKEIISPTTMPPTEPSPEQKKQTVLATQWELLFNPIKGKGEIPEQLKSKAENFIKKSKEGSLQQSEIIEAQKFFENLSTITKPKKEEILPETPIIELPKPAFFMDLITQLQNNQIITITDFLHYLENAKKNNFNFYFISTALADSVHLLADPAPLSDKINYLSQLNKSQPELFNDQEGNTLYGIYAIASGFVIMVSADVYPNLNNSPAVILVPLSKKPTSQEKLTILNSFNVKRSPQDTEKLIQQLENQNIIHFQIGAKTELESLYDTILTTQEIKQRMQEQEIIQQAQPKNKVDVYAIILPEPPQQQRAKKPSKTKNIE